MLWQYYKAQSLNSNAPVDKVSLFFSSDITYHMAYDRDDVKESKFKFILHLNLTYPPAPEWTELHQILQIRSVLTKTYRNLNKDFFKKKNTFSALSVL